MFDILIGSHFLSRRGLKRVWFKFLIVTFLLISVITVFVQPGNVKAVSIAANSASSFNFAPASFSQEAVTAQVAEAQHGTRLNATASNTNLSMVLSLKVSSNANIDQFIQELYDPASPTYKQFLSPEEYTKRFIDSTDRTTVINFLQGQGLTVKDNGLGSLINFEGTVAQVQKAFNVQISDYKDATTNRVFYANDVTPALPLSIAAKVEGIFGLENYTQAQPGNRRPDIQPTTVQPNAVNPGTPVGCSGALSVANTGPKYTPNQIKTAYNFDGLTSEGITGTGQTVALYELADFADSEPNIYQDCFRNSSPRVPVTRHLNTTFGSITSYDSEVPLDIEIVAGMAPGLSNILVYEAANNGSGYLGEYQQIANDNLSKVVSSSWYNCEANRGSSGLSALNTIFQQMAVQGQTLFTITGDTGSEGCQRLSGSTILNIADGDGPYATTVGGTKLAVNSGNAISSEIVWNEYLNGTGAGYPGAGGGGISTYFNKPTYQLSPSLTNTLSTGKRQVPDVTAFGDFYNTGYVVYIGGWDYNGGTSAAAPLWATEAALVNEFLSRHGLPGLGFANPSLYTIFNSASYSSVFHDITIGDNCYNTACRPPSSSATYYPALTGYDMASGIGSLNAYNLALKLANLTPTTVTATSSLNPSVFGQNVTFSANVSPTTATGSVVFTDTTSHSLLGTATLSGGSASINVSNLSVGSHNIVATYPGNASYNGSDSTPIMQVVSKANTTTSLVSVPDPAQAGQAVTLNATILVSSPGAGNPSGSVTFKEGSTVLGVSTISSGVASLSLSNLSIGSHTIIAIYSGDSSFNSSSSAGVTLDITPYTYYLPFLANQASGFTSYLAIQNTGTSSTPANVTVSFFNTSGQTLTGSTIITTVAQYGEVLPPNPFATGATGAGVITSDQPLNVIVAEATPFGGSAYAVSQGSSQNLIAPLAINNSGGFNTQLTIFNGGSSSVTATVSFYALDGTTPAGSTQILSIGAKQGTTLDQTATTGSNPSNLPTGFYGWARITSPTGSQLVAQVLEQNPGNRFVAIANAQSSSRTTLYAPAIFKNAYGGFVTGANIVNPNITPVTVNVAFYSLAGGAPVTTTVATIGAESVLPLYQGSNGDLPTGFAGAAVITSTGSGVVMVVNEANQNVTSGSQSGTYSSASSGSGVVGLPVIANNGFGYTTGTTIFNASSTTTTFTLTYYGIDGQPITGLSPTTYTLAPFASQGVFQGGVQGLSYGTAVVKELTGAPNALIDTTNAVNAAGGLFYTYTEPNQ